MIWINQKTTIIKPSIEFERLCQLLLLKLRKTQVEARAKNSFKNSLSQSNDFGIIKELSISIIAWTENIQITICQRKIAMFTPFEKAWFKLYKNEKFEVFLDIVIDLAIKK